MRAQEELVPPTGMPMPLRVTAAATSAGAAPTNAPQKLAPPLKAMEHLAAAITTTQFQEMASTLVARQGRELLSAAPSQQIFRRAPHALDPCG